MKKSKVIIPAMALLLFSTAASVTGTVAWFTSTRVFTTSAAKFGINTVDGSLEATVAARIGTKLNANGVEADENCRLTHGSFNALTAAEENSTATKAAIIDQDSTEASRRYKILDAENSAFNSVAGKSNNSNWFITSALEETTTYRYYVAFSWSVTFKYTFGSADNGKTFGVYLDVAASTFTANATPVRASQEGGSGLRTATGFRVAFLPDAAGTVTHGKVFGNTTAVSGKYVVSTTGTADYTTSNYMIPNPSAKRYLNKDETPGTGEAVAVGTEVECIYTTTATEEKTVYCVAWYEGEDPGVVTKAQMDEVTASLTFYAREVNPA